MLDQTVQVLHARSAAYRLLAVFLSLPNETVARGVVGGAVREDLAAILDEGLFGDSEKNVVLSVYDAGDSPEVSASVGSVLTTLRRDYTRLFTNPERALVPVYEAVFKGADDFDTSQLTFISPTALDARRSYRELGLDMSSDVRDSPDHMAAECDFACFAYRELALAIEADDSDRVDDVERVLGRFMQNHLLKWQDKFFSLVAENAATPMYRAIGELGVLLAAGEGEAFATKQERGASE